VQDAGSAEGFRKVDYDYVAAAAAAAKAAGVPYFGLVSAQGANAGVPPSDWRLLHPLLYTHTKGRVSRFVCCYKCVSCVTVTFMGCF
jgi:hypothetical protein